MSVFRQICAVIDMNLRNLRQRVGASLVIIIGVAGVVGVLISILAMASGFARAVAGTGSPERAIILSSDAPAETMSSIPGDTVANITDAPGIPKDARGRPIAEAEVLAQAQVSKGGQLISLTLRGTGPVASELRPEIHLVAGRMFRPGLHELIVGRNAEAQYSGLQIGNHLSFQDAEWTIVGVFASTRPSLLESELLADATTLLFAYQQTWFQSVTVRLDGPEGLGRLQAALAADPSLHVTVDRESDYEATQSQSMSKLLRTIGYFIGGVMAAGALFGALNTLYAAVSTRSLEIATLRAIGFGPTAVVISVLAEALLLSIAGALAGAFIAWLLYDGHVMSMERGGQQTQLAFSIAVTPGLIGLGIVLACLIGVAGGLLPAIRAARLPVARALTALS